MVHLCLLLLGRVFASDSCGEKDEPIPFPLWLSAYCSNRLCIYFLLKIPTVEAIGFKVTDLLSEPF